jgi:dipeptidyl aminopeptidase/acylaminoacyl peptidase
MKKLIILFMSISLLNFSSGKASEKKSGKNMVIIGKSNISINNGLMTPETLWSFGRIGNVSISKDRKKIAYEVRYYSIPENKSNSEIFVMNVDGSDKKQITNTPFSETNPIFIDGDKKIAFLSTESGKSQIWTMTINGKKRKQLSDYKTDIESFSFSPDEKKILFIAQVKCDEPSIKKYADLDKSTGIIANDLMYRHWDKWTESVPHPFVADIQKKKITNIIDLLQGEPYESPLQPFGGIEQLTWNPNSTEIAYTCKKKTGKEYSLSTNSDIYIYNTQDKTTRNITEGMMGYDTNPQFSSDGKYISWLSMEHDGYESDLNRLFVMNISTQEKTFVSDKFESNVDNYCWSSDNKSIFFTGIWHGTSQIYEVGLDKNLRKITTGQHDYISISLTDNGLIAKKHSMSQADEIYSVDIQSGKSTELSFENEHLYKQLKMGEVAERWVTTTDNKQMLVWVVYPPNFDKNKKYPALLYCQGGPQSAVSQFWSYRWNMQIMAANGYIVVAPNRRGLPGFGKEWNEQISGDYGGQCMQDYLSTIDEVKKEPYVDADRLGCVGASFGAYSVYWLAGHHNKRFKAFIAHDGIFNLEMQYLETEEMWFANWDLGGPYWDKSNEVAQKTFANSPHLFIDKWDTPILCVHGEKDYRILSNQTTAAFNAAKLRNIPAQLLIFPDENHWVTKPQNGILWQRTFFDWLDKWLKKE